MTEPVALFLELKRLTWIIHESRLLQLRGVMDAAVVLHPESPSQQSRHRVRPARPWGVNLAPSFSW